MQTPQKFGKLEMDQLHSGKTEATQMAHKVEPD